MEDSAQRVCRGGFGGAQLNYGRDLGLQRWERGMGESDGGKDSRDSCTERQRRTETDTQTETEAIREGRRDPETRRDVEPPGCRAPHPRPGPCAHLVAPESHALCHSQQCWVPPAAEVPLPRPVFPVGLPAGGSGPQGGGTEVEAGMGAPPDLAPPGKALGRVCVSHVRVCCSGTGYVHLSAVRVSAPVSERVFACAPVCVWAGGVTVSCPCIRTCHYLLQSPSLALLH